jgi:hypothetical protein
VVGSSLNFLELYVWDFFNLKKNPNQRTTGSGYLKNIQNQRLPGSEYFKTQSKKKNQ